MTLQPGTRLGSYEIVAPLGAGGMGEVFRARDPRLGREVAIKVLPASVADNADRLQRFELEARAAGSLNHPSLVTIFEFGTHEGAPFIAMELLEGETLRDRLGNSRASSGDTTQSGSSKTNAISQRRAIEWAAQIAHGLAAAHEKGLVHRDLKPENIFITRDNRAKILDFGLAKLMAPGDDEVNDDLTAKRNTAPGTVLGTAGYMAPEQVRGRDVDHRADLFSFGAIFYEMLTGRRAFTGNSAADIMSAILREEAPDISESHPHLPPALARIVQHCLEKEASMRFQSARDLAFDLEAIAGLSGSSTAMHSRGVSAKRWLPFAIATLCGVAVTALAFTLVRQGAPSVTASAETDRVVAQLTFQAGNEGFPSLSPDGETFVYVSASDGDADIYFQRVDGFNPINLTKDNAGLDAMPAFSPDGKQIAFRSDRDGGGIFVMGATGESVRRLTDFGYNPAWLPDGRSIVVASEPIAFSPEARNTDSYLWIVEVANGEKRQLTDFDAVQPAVSPNGHRVAFWGVYSGGSQRDIRTVAVTGGKETVVAVTDDPPLEWNPVWSPDGKHLYFGSDRDGTLNLWRVAIDEQSGKTLGAPEPLQLPASRTGQFSVARRGGRLLFSARRETSKLHKMRFDPSSGKVTPGEPPQFGGTLPISFLSVSPDGQWIAARVDSPTEDLVVMRTDGSEIRRITNDSYRDRGPHFMPDGRSLLFYAARGGPYQLWSIRIDGSGLEQLTNLSEKDSVVLPVPSPDGRWIAGWNEYGAWLFDRANSMADQKPVPLPVGSRDGKQLFFSPVGWSADSKRLVGVFREGDGVQLPGVVICDVETKAFETVHETARPTLWLRKSGLVLIGHDDGRIATLDPVRRIERPIDIPFPVSSVGASADDTTLVLHETESESDIWLLEEKAAAPPPT